MEPAYVRSLRDQARGLDVSFHDHLDGAPLAKLMRSCQVMALPSAYEGFGIAYLEAMGFGLPVIGTRAGAARELVSPGKTGFLIAPGDSAALAAQLAALHADRAKLTRLSLAALKAYKTFPTWQQSLRKIEDFLSSYNQSFLRKKGQR
jgi:glycosyltransferase involved in cell wall biosynthesis